MIKWTKTMGKTFDTLQREIICQSITHEEKMINEQMLPRDETQTVKYLKRCSNSFSNERNF